MLLDIMIGILVRGEKKIKKLCKSLFMAWMAYDTVIR